MHRVRDATEVARSAAHNPSTSRIESEAALNPSGLEKKVHPFWPTLGSTLSSVSRRTPTPSASNWPRYLPRKLVGGGEAALSF